MTNQLMLYLKKRNLIWFNKFQITIKTTESIISHIFILKRNLSIRILKKWLFENHQIISSCNNNTLQLYRSIFSHKWQINFKWKVQLDNINIWNYSESNCALYIWSKQKNETLWKNINYKNKNHANFKSFVKKSVIRNL